MSLKNFTYNDYKQIVINQTPLIDVRAPIEFTKGAFLNSFNYPIMNDEERHQVGICYKQKGNAEATKLGHQLVSGKVREERIDAWKNQLAKYPETLIYCFRGGQRSQISQEWIYESTGIRIPRLEGGYKALRNYLISALEPEQITVTPLILGGCTGAGKTILLKKVKEAVDLEGIANHRGSAFGKHITQQPTQINFENNLAYKIIQHENEGYKIMLLEDEGNHIGKCYLPRPLANFFNNSPRLLLEVSLYERIENTLDEYVIVAQQEYISELGNEEGLKSWFDYMSGAFENIKRKLGGELYQRIYDSFKKAFDHQKITDDYEPHKKWIELLLKEYYDPMYEYQLEKINNKIIFRGTEKEILQKLKTLS